jgi:hypothetical protein
MALDDSAIDARRGAEVVSVDDQESLTRRTAPRTSNRTRAVGTACGHVGTPIADLSGTCNDFEQMRIGSYGSLHLDGRG